MQKIPNSLSMSPQKNWQLVVDSYTPEIFTWNLENDVSKMTGLLDVANSRVLLYFWGWIPHSLSGLDSNTYNNPQKDREKWKKVIYQYLKMEKIEKTSIIPYPILCFCYTAMIPSHGLTVTDIPRNGSWAFRLTPIRSMRLGAIFMMLHTAGIQPNQHVSRQQKNI